MKRRTRGFSLIEAVIAMVVLVVGILAVAQVFMTAVFARQKGGNLAIAEDRITGIFEKWRGIRLDRLDGEEIKLDMEDGQEDGKFPVTDPANPDRNVGTGQVTMEELAVERLMKVTIAVEVGKVRGPQTTVTSTTYFVKRQ